MRGGRWKVERNERRGMDGIEMKWKENREMKVTGSKSMVFLGELKGYSSLKVWQVVTTVPQQSEWVWLEELFFFFFFCSSP